MAIAAALLALGVYGISRLDAPEPRDVASAGRPAASRAASEGGVPTSGSSAGGAPGRPAAAPAARPAPRPTASTPDAPPVTRGGERTPEATAGSRAANAGEPAAERAGGSAGGSADRDARGASSTGQGAADASPAEPPTELSAEVGVSVAPEALGGAAGRRAADTSGGARRAGGGAASTRTELALEPADGADRGVTTERLASDSAPAAAGESRPAGAARAPGDSAAESAADGTRGRWRVTARAPGTQRLRVLALDVRDSAGRVDTVARREIATVDVPLGTAAGDAAGAAVETPDAPWRGPAAWIAACLLSFFLGWLARGGGRGAADPASDGVPDAGDDPERRA